MSILVSRLVAALPGGIDKSQQLVPGIVIAGPGTIAVNGLSLYTLSNDIATTIDMHGQSVQTVSSLLSSALQASMVNNGLAELLVVPGSLAYVTAPTTLMLITAPLWIIMAAIARALEGELRKIRARTSQMNLSVATGSILDWWGASLGISRYTNEPDTLYAQRIIALRFVPDANNVAIEQIFASLGYVAHITDADPGTFVASIEWPAVPPSGFVYSQTQLEQIVSTTKAAGIIATVEFLSQLEDSVVVSDATSAVAQQSNAQAWGGTLPDGTGYQEGFTWNQATWQ